jgi:hypothetical protein
MQVISVRRICRSAKLCCEFSEEGDYFGLNFFRIPTNFQNFAKADPFCSICHLQPLSECFETISVLIRRKQLEEVNHLDVIHQQIAVNPIALKCWSQLRDGTANSDKLPKSTNFAVQRPLRLVRGIDVRARQTDPIRTIGAV